MPRKEPLYLKKSKTARQLQSDYGFNSESERFLTVLEKVPGRDKHQKITDQYKKKSDFIYYEDQDDRRVAHTYDENLYVDSDNTYDSDKTYIDYITEKSTKSSSAESVLGEQHEHKKIRKKRQQNSGSVIYNNHKKQKNCNNYRKQRSSLLNYNENRTLGDEPNFNVYVSQQSISSRNKNEGNLQQKILEYITQPTSKEYIGSKIPPDLTELTTNTTPNIAQSVLQIMYLPFSIMDKNNPLQSTGRIQSGLNETNKTTGSNIFTPLFSAHTVRTVLSAISAQNNIFEKKTKTVSKGQVSIPVQNHKQNKFNMSFEDPFEKEELKNKLRVSNLGNAMTTESYASLIVSHQKDLRQGEPILKKVYKQLKNTANLQPIQKNVKVDNEQHKIHSPMKSGIATKEMSIANLNTMGDCVTKQEKQEQKNVIKNSSMIKKPIKEELNNKKTPEQKDKISQMETKDLECRLKENSSYIQGLKNYELESEMNQNNKNSGGENLKKKQQEDDYLKWSTLSKAQVTKQQSKKPLSALASKYKKVNKLGKASQFSADVLYNEDMEINNNLEVMSNVNDQSFHKRQGDNNLTESSGEGPPLEIIYSLPITSSALGEQSTNNILFLQNEEPGDTLNVHFPKFSEYNEEIYIFFQTAQFILGVSGYDKLINVFNLFYYKSG